MIKFFTTYNSWCGLCFVLCAVLCAGCGATPQPAAPPPAAAAPTASAPEVTPAALAALASRVSPCAAGGAPGTSGADDIPAAPQGEAAPAAQPLAAGMVHYEDDTNTIVVRRGAQTTLAGVSAALGREAALRQAAPGEWLLSANMRIEAGAALRIAAPEARWLKLRSDEHGFVWIKALGGQLEFANTCVSSWDAARGGYDENYKDGRSFVLARDGARMAIHGSDLRYLGYDGPEAYGLAWRIAGTSGEIVDSYAAYNYYGIYSYEVADLVIRGNEAHHNIMYGIDPHTRSARLVIENNVAHDNGKHGIILAEECSDGVIRNNVAYNNLHHGIVIFQRSNNNLVEGNTAYGNGGHGININNATNTTVRGNLVYHNLEAGIGVGQQAAQTQVLSNTVRANRKDGITLYSDVTGSVLRQNTVSDNARYGIYIKSEGGASIEANRVTSNQVGVYLNMANPLAVSQQTNEIYGNREGEVSTAQAPAQAEAEDQP